MLEFDIDQCATVHAVGSVLFVRPFDIISTYVLIYRRL